MSQILAVWNRYYVISFDVGGILQSYGGAGSVGTIRRTHLIPTKSAVASMLAVAGGIADRPSEVDDLCRAFSMAVIVLNHGEILEDFQTIQGYATVVGGIRADDTLITPKQYLVDALFRIVLDFGSDQGEQRIARWLRNPAGVITIGRRCCLPSVPILPTISSEFPAWLLRYVECAPSDAGAFDMRDNYTNSRLRAFGPRWVKREEKAE